MEGKMAKILNTENSEVFCEASRAIAQGNVFLKMCE